MASTSAGGVTKSLTEACTESSPRGNNKNLKLRVDEYDMAKMEAILKQEIAEIDRKLDKQYFPSNFSNNNNNNSNNSTSSRSKARKTTLSNDPNELRHIQLKKSVLFGEQDEPTMFKKNQQIPKPLTRTLSKDPREMMEIEKNVVDRNSDRNLLGVVPRTAPVSNKVTPRKKNCTLTNDIREQRDTDKRRKALSTHCTPYGSIENLADLGAGEVFEAERVGVIMGGNTILGVSDPDQKGPRRRHFSTNHVELRDLERHQPNNDNENNRSAWPKSQPQTPRAKRKTLTNDAAEMRKVQEKENMGGEEEFAIGFKKNQPRVGPLSALVSKEKHHNLFNPTDDTNDSIGIMPRTCPNTPVMSKRRVTTLSNDSGEIQKIRHKYDPDKWNAQDNDDLPRVILNGPNQCKARPKQMSLATNDFDMKRIQARTGQVEGLAHIFGSPAQRCQKFEPNGTIPAEDAVTDFLQFGKSGGGAPLRDKDGRLITGVGGKFKKDYYNLNKDPEAMQKQKAEQSRVLEEAKAVIEGNKIKKKSTEIQDQRVSVDLADKIRKLDSVGYNKPDRTHARATSDVTRTKLDIRYPTEAEARQYYENLKQQEAENKSRRNSTVNPGDLPTAQKNGPLTPEGITRNGLVYGQNDVTPQRDARIMKLGTSLGQPQCGEVSVSSKYDKEGRKLQTPFATDN